jgi:hypothetical protein
MTAAPPGTDLAWTLPAWEACLRAGPLDQAVTLLAAVTGLPFDAADGTELGGRDAILAATLLRLAGTPVWTCVRCAGCGEWLDVALGPELLPVAADPPGPVELTAPVAGGRIAFRLPTTADLRLLTRAGGDPGSARWLLLRALLPDGAELTEGVAQAVEAAMEKASPGAAVTVAVGCPQCGSSTEAGLDVPALLWKHVETAATAMLAQVHTLAAAYGWAEADILALSPARRAAYLAMVDQ